MSIRGIGMKITEYVNIKNPDYSYYRVTPVTSIRNYNSSYIASAVQTLHRPLKDRIYKENGVLNVDELAKVALYIHISKSDVEFYFILPSYCEELFKEKISSVWPKANISKISDIPWFKKDSLKYELGYIKNDALSIDVNKKCNEPLNSILNVLDIMQSDDRVGIYYNFMPTSQKGWRKSFDRSIDKYKNNKNIDKHKLDTDYIIKMSLFIICEALDLLLCRFTELLGKTNTKSHPEVALSKDYKKEPTKSTKSKRESTIINTQILTFSESEDKARARMNILSVCESFKSINEDNELKYEKIRNKKEYSPISYKLSGVVINQMSTEELQNFLELPGKELLYKHKNIKRIDTLEEKVPQELSTGYMSLGTAKYMNLKQEAFLPYDKLYGNLPVTLCGPEGSGKSTVLIRRAYESWKDKKACIVIDYIKNNEVSRKIMKLIPKEDLVVIDCGKHESIQGLGYNEIIPKSDNPYEILESASMQAEQDVCLIDSCNSDPLSGRMLKYYLAAANIVHIRPYKNMSNVIDCLENYIARKGYIEHIKTLDVIIQEELSSEIQTLKELDELDKDGNIVGTKASNITFILDRIIKLKSNYQLRHMYSKNCKDNVNFVEAINNKKVILIMMPQLKFATPISRNVCATYFISKTWLAAQIRGAEAEDPELVNIIIDELYQVPVAEHLIGETIEQARKFGNRYIFSCHNFNQLKIAPILKSEGSYIFMKGCDKSNIETFEDDLNPFTYEDIQHMKEWHALNLIKYKGGYAKFITLLPKPIK